MPSDLLEISVQMTMVGGVVEFCDEAALGDFCQPADYFQVDSLRITASAFLPGQTPDLALDNQEATNWGAGSHPPQWIQVDLGDEVPIASIELIVDQSPDGPTVHQIEARGSRPLDAFQTLHVFDQVTSFGQRLVYTAPDDLEPFRYIRIHTTESPSWVAWKEIRIARRTSVATARGPEPGGEGPTIDSPYPNPTSGSTRLAFRLPQPGHVRLSIYDVLGRERAIPVDAPFPQGQFDVTWNAASLPSGPYVVLLQVNGAVRTARLVVAR